MGMIKLSPFGGIIPKTGSRLIGNNDAQVANNVMLQSGELKPLRAPLLVNAPNKPKPALSIFRAWFLDASAWLSWTTDVDTIRAPLSADVEPRFVWTGDGIPRIGTYSNIISSGNNDYPYTSYALGVPAPLAKPAVSHSGGTGAATTRIYTQTFFSALGEESAPAPVSDLTTGKVDGTWAITGLSALPVNSGNITAITYAGKSVTITTTAQHFNRVGEGITLTGVTTVTNVNGTWTLTAADQTAKTMTFAVTGTPSGAYNNTTDTIDAWARTVNFNVTSMKRRLYRSAGLTGSVQLVHDDVGTTYNDTLSDAAIMGDELLSAGWSQPPVGLKGIKVHSSGALAGFFGNVLCLSEPYQAHAWPEVYQMATDRDIVGIGSFGSEIGIGTKGVPWMASGVDPASMSMEKINSLYPCLSKRSLIEYGDGLVYASAHGVVYAGASGVKLLTDNFYTTNEWRDLNPSSMVFSTAYGRLYIAFQRSDNSRSMLILDGNLLVTADVSAYDIYADESTSDLFISNAEGINSWDDNNSYPLNLSWRSKDFVLPAPVNLGAAKVEFEQAIDSNAQAAIQANITAAEVYNAGLLTTGNVGGSINAYAYNEIGFHSSLFRKVPGLPPANQVNFILRKNGKEIVVSRTVLSNTAFRLPDGYKADVYSIEVLSQCKIREVRIAETMDGLRGA